MRQQTPERWEDPFSLDIVKEYFQVVDDPAEADLALVGIGSPDGGVGYERDDIEKGGNGYLPISLQYGEYKAVNARDPSITGGSPFESFTNRSYRDKTVTARNSNDLTTVKETRENMGDKPVIVLIDVSKPMVFKELEPLVDGILIHMGVQDQALMDLLTGQAEPTALLPFQMPANMHTVEEQFEDVPRDMECYTDSEGNVYDFAFGLNWSGVIDDDRVAAYR